MLPPLVLVLSAAVLGQQAPGPAAAKPSAKATGVIEDFKADARQYVMRLDARPDATFTLRDEPLLHWGNPARTGEDGAVFVWLLDGRPQVVGSVFTYRLPKVIRRKHEYHSLASGPLTATYHDQRVWAPRSAGVTWQPVPDAPSLPPTARGRLSQMKSLARNFSAVLERRTAEKDELRLLPQPLLRYESKDKEVDGALFSFSIGTDPEVILLLEATLDGSSPAWHYAFARFHFLELRAWYQDHEVWHVDAMPEEVSLLEIGTLKYQQSVYATYHTATTPVEEPQ